MNPTILKRLAALEKRPAKPKAFDQFAIEQLALAETGLTRDQFKAKFGGVPGYAYLKMVKGDGSPHKPLPAEFNSPQDYYFAILKTHS